MLTLVPRCRFRRTAISSLCLAVSVALFPAPAECLPAATACSQGANQRPIPHILRSKVTLQTVDVQVTDQHGNDVRGLAANDFTVREDGQWQKIAFFDDGRAPVTVTVLVDSSVSVSQHSKAGSAEQLAVEFMRIARPGDDIYAMNFTDHNGPFEHLTGEQLRKSGPLTVPLAAGTGSALYDAIATAICHLRDSKNPRQAIVVITDGIDEHSRLTLNQLIDAVRSQRAQLFLIGVHSKPQFRARNHKDPTVTLATGRDIDNPDYVFYRLAKEAGAAAFVLNSESGVRKALKDVSDMLNAEYTLAYYPPPTRRKLRHIQVRVDRHGVRVLASRTIVSNRDSSDAVVYQPGTCLVSPWVYPHPYELLISGEPGQQIYRDDFSDRHSGWPIHSHSHYVSGGYEISTLEQARNKSFASARWLHAGGWPPGSGFPIYREDVIAAYGPPWSDFRVSATVRLFELPPQWRAQPGFSLPLRPIAGLAFRLSWKGYYALLISPSIGHDARWTLELVARKFQGDSYTESVLVPWTKTVVRDSRLEGQLAVQDVGGQIALFIDGQQVGAAHDETFNYGYAGFVVFAPAHAIFSRLLLEQK